MNLFKKNLSEIQNTLNSYSLIGVRDSITYNMVQDASLESHIPVLRVPDPAFLHGLDEKSTTTIAVLEKYGVDMTKPIVGFIFHGNSHLAEQLADVYHSQGYQIISISMYNPFADVNLAHVLSPHEWANAFPLMSFCITDRFHGTIMCLKSKIPFIAIEPYIPATQNNSKILSLLSDFELLDCYVNEYDDGFNIDLFLERIHFLKNNWEGKYKHIVEKKLVETKNTHLEYLSKIRDVLLS